MRERVPGGEEDVVLTSGVGGTDKEKERMAGVWNFHK